MPSMTEIASAPQHLLSFSRVLLGALVWTSSRATGESEWALPATFLAVAFDFADGRLARARGTSSNLGRVIDNACDAAFLALAFLAFRREIGGAPLVFFALSFGSYGARALWSATMHKPFTPSPRGHWAGISNYALALIAATHVHPSIDLSRPALYTAVAIVVFLNAVAFYDNLRLARVDARTS
jgi:phosphatidylglycerophosphate synthase